MKCTLTILPEAAILRADHAARELNLLGKFGVYLR